MKRYIKLILISFGLLMTTANYAQFVTDYYGGYGPVFIDASSVHLMGEYMQPRPTNVDGTNTSIGTPTHNNLGFWATGRYITAKFELDRSDSFATNWLEAANSCASSGKRLATVADFWMISVLKKELEELTNFTPFRTGDAGRLPATAGTLGWHYWVATELWNWGEHCYLMVFNDNVDRLTTSMYLGQSSKAGIMQADDSGNIIPYYMPFRCVRDVY